MCGRFTLFAEKVEIIKAFGLEQKIDNFYEKRYNIAPGQKILVIVHDGKGKRAGQLQWGLVPSWAKDPSIGYKMINARSESAHEKPSFKKLLTRRRCLVVADSFYEWKQVDGMKQPMRIHPKDRELFAFAGLWDRWKDGDKELVTCTILTQEANEFMQDIHHRMPIILPKEKEDWWLDPQPQDASYMVEGIRQLEMEDLEAYPVSMQVNNAKNDLPDCIVPLTS
ncbi:SOS response-associated peptidase [Bacillaceae bacterium S4-13-56]